MELQTITPVFIGSGDVYSGIDYFEYNGYVYFVDFNKILDYKITGNKKKACEEIEQFINRNLRNNQLQNKNQFYTSDFINNIIKNKLYIYSLPSKERGKFERHSNEIRAFVKSSLKPIIPGSSIKGALRTAILFDAIEEIDFNKLFEAYGKRGQDLFKNDLKKQLNNSINRKYNKQNIRLPEKCDFIDYFFNKLSISDVSLEGNGSVMMLKKYGMSEKPADFLAVEAYEGFGKVSLSSPIGFESLKEIVNTYTKKSLEYIRKKLEFESELEVEGILSKMDKEDGMYVLIGGYNGWYAKTLHEHIITHPKFEGQNDSIRKRLNLGLNPRNKKFSKEFPKTYTLTSDNKVLGVVKIT